LGLTQLYGLSPPGWGQDHPKKKLGRSRPKRVGPTSARNKGRAYVGPTRLLQRGMGQTQPRHFGLGQN